MSEAKCPQCGVQLPASSPQGLCPACLLRKGMSPTREEQNASGGGWTPPTPERIAELFPEFDSIELVGRGGMGAVYKVRQVSLDRVVALKVLPPQLATDPGFAMRFTREAQAMAKLSHPHIITIFEFGERHELYYFIMEYIDGASLRNLIDVGGISAREALAIVPQICDALQFAHDNGVVHRDIKPENILLDRAGKVKIADFGLARIAQGSATAPQAFTGVVMGTPYYMAPEQLTSPQAVDHRADIYALGVVFYQLLTGELPIGRFDAPSKKVLVDVRLDEVVLRSLEREPDRRYQHVSEVKTQVENIASTAPVHGRAGMVLGILLVGQRNGKPWVSPWGMFRVLFTIFTLYVVGTAHAALLVPLQNEGYVLSLLVLAMMGMVFRAITLQPTRLIDMDNLPGDFPPQTLLTGWKTLFKMAQLRKEQGGINWPHAIRAMALALGTVILVVAAARLLLRIFHALPSPINGLATAGCLLGAIAIGFGFAAWMWNIPANERWHKYQEQEQAPKASA